MNEQTKPQSQDTQAASGLSAPLPAKHTFKSLKSCTTLEEAFQTSEFLERIKASVPQHVQPGRMLRTFVSAVSKTPLLAQVSLRSFLGACLTASQVGLEPNTPLGHLWLIPFKTKVWNPETRRRDKEQVEVNTIFGYPGLLDLSFRTTKVKGIHADIVWPGDEFSYEFGTNAHLKHRPRGHKPDDRPLYGYMHAQLDGGQAFEVMPYDDILAVRNKAQAYRYALAAREAAEAENKRLPRTWLEAPWVAYETAMARKTVFRSGSKWLPRSVELASAIALDEAQDRRRHMDFSTVMDAPTIDGTPDYLGAATDAAAGSDDEPSDQGQAAGVDPTAAFSRRPSEDVSAVAQTKTSQAEAEARRAQLAQSQAEQAKRAAAARAASVESQAAAQTQPAKSEMAWGFEATLIDSTGEAGDELFINAVTFARAYLALWREANRAEDADAIEALAQHNADALGQAEADPAAALILRECRELTEADPVEQNVELTFEEVVPPMERGKISWPGYVKAIKIMLGQINPIHFAAWTLAQQAMLARCPMGQRALAVRAISDAARLHRMDAPVWLSELLRPPLKDTPVSETSEPAVSQAEPVSDADERWVNAMIADLGAITDRTQFDQIVASMPVRTVMARLRRERRDLFDRADNAFSAKHQALPVAQPQGQG